MPEGVSLVLGVDEAGQRVEMVLNGHSGLFVSGAPGSGKSAWLTAAIAGLSMYSDVQIVAIDGKHGHDLDALAPRCIRYLAGPSGADPLTVLMTLRDVQELMRRRLDNALEWFGDSNYWTSGPHLDHPLLVVLIDEAQTYLDLRSALDRAEKDLLGEITSVTMDLVKKGRSAGILVCLATQKGTTDAIPSAIRDQCGLRVCFRVMTSEVAVAALGYLPTGSPSPVGEDTGIGIAVSPSLAGVRFRADFVPAEVISATLVGASDLTCDPGFAEVLE
jgi:DNA segregation ATPase FtsK/SpoIIIE-like protein